MRDKSRRGFLNNKLLICTYFMYIGDDANTQLLNHSVTAVAACCISPAHMFFLLFIFHNLMFQRSKSTVIYNTWYLVKMHIGYQVYKYIDYLV